MADVPDETAVSAAATRGHPRRPRGDAPHRPSGMLDAVAGFPAQVEDGWATLPLARAALAHAASERRGAGHGRLGDRRRPRARHLVRIGCAVPVEVVRDYELPAWVGARDARRRVLLQRRDRGDDQRARGRARAALPGRVITTGGPLGEVARRAELPLLTFPGARLSRARRSATRWRILAGLLERAGVLHARRCRDRRGRRDRAGDGGRAADPTCRPPTNPAKQLAWALLDRLPSSRRAAALAPVARRWKTQLNENSKSAAVVGGAARGDPQHGRRLRRSRTRCATT